MGAISFNLDPRLVEELRRHLPLDCFVETGTFRGDSLEQARQLFPLCYSVEWSSEYHAVARERFRDAPNVRLFHGESPVFLRTHRDEFAARATLFWLDAHWCIAGSAGEKSQCPLLAELAAIGRLNDRSVVVIDDARLFLAPPPAPYEISDWPDFEAVLASLRQLSVAHGLICANDVMIFAPRVILPALRQFGHDWTADLLTLADKARDYDKILAQSQDKDREIDRLSQAAAGLRLQLADKDAALRECDTTTRDLTRHLGEKDAGLQKAHALAGELGRQLTDKDAALQASQALAEELRHQLIDKDTALEASQALAGGLRRQLTDKDAALQASQALAARLASQLKEKGAALQQSGKLGRRLAAQVEEKERARLMFEGEHAAQARAAEERLAALEAASAQLEGLRAEHATLARAMAESRARSEELARQLADTDAVRQEISGLRVALAATEARLAAGEKARIEMGAGLVAKESVIQDLKRACDERDLLINRLAGQSANPVSDRALVVRHRFETRWRRWRYTWQRRLNQWLEEHTACRLAELVQYPPRPMTAERFPRSRPPREWPRICLITPSFNQAAFLPRTMDSVLGQDYPRLAYGVQDGGSTDGSAAIIESRIARLTHAESARDQGQADAIQKGFLRLYPERRDLMAWLNSDDMLMPGALRFVGEYFARHPEVDVIYGHRVIIDEHDREVGRWYLPRYHDQTLKWFDLIPQETLFWRASCFADIGGMDPSFHFAMDWDLLLRFEAAGYQIRRVPYFLGCFRVHSEQKTSARIQTLGEEEMARLRLRVHSGGVTHADIHRQLEAEKYRSAVVEWWHRRGIRR